MSDDTPYAPKGTAPIAFVQPAYSGWECELFGCGKALVLRPPKGQIPNAFWRLMQRLAFGNRWLRIPPA